MDKYEYKLKLEQLKELVSLERYYEAAAITDEINWNKVRNIGTLTMVGKVYEHLKRYEDARDVFTLAYDRSPVSRTVLLHLTKLSLSLVTQMMRKDIMRSLSNARRETVCVMSLHMRSQPCGMLP